MVNTDISAARRYHEGTKHSQERVRSSTHTLDWDNRPLPYKIYSTLPPLALPTDLPPSSPRALDAVASPGSSAGGERIPDLAMLSRLFQFSNGITKVLHVGGRMGDMPFRAAACTGALFHIELYLVCGDLPDLPAGVYHYGAHDHSLRRLREGDFRRVLVDATGAEEAVSRAPAIVVCTDTFWRNAWKYTARAYRHTFWDSGTILANFLAEATALELPASLVLGFADERVNCLIDVDGEREAAVSLVAVGTASQAPPPAPPVSPLTLPTEPLSRYELDFPPIREMHTTSSLRPEDVAAWRGTPPSHPLPPAAGAITPLQPLPPADLPDDPIERVIRRRGSTRQFTPEPITFAQLSTVIDRSTRGIAADCLDPAAPLNDLYLVVNAVEGLPSGTYVYRPADHALELLRADTFRAEAGHLALDQDLGADAAVNIYFLCDLAPVLERFGNRGYGVAQLEAAMTAGKMYLAAYALRLGASGLTFFDDEVVECFSPHAAGQSVMFLVTLGHPQKRRARHS